MENIEEKLKLDNEIAVARKQLKDTLSDLDIAKKEQSALESIKEKNIRLIDEQKIELRDTLLAISDAKNSWNQEKAAEEKDIEDKNSKVDAILSRSAELDKQEEDINELVRKDQEILTKNHQILLDTDAQKVAIDAVKAEIETKEKDLKAQEDGIDRKIQNHKDKVISALNEIIKT